jgi:N-acyl-L-homoserine lactone synthetase
MLKLIEGSYSSFFPKEMNAMFRNRAETFSERLRWDVVVENGYERDHFDDANPLYLVSVDPDTEDYWGSLRLLPTTGPNMLRDVFPICWRRGSKSKARPSGKFRASAARTWRDSPNEAGAGSITLSMSSSWASAKWRCLRV